jgi:hypothetical protein
MPMGALLMKAPISFPYVAELTAVVHNQGDALADETTTRFWVRGAEIERELRVIYTPEGQQLGQRRRRCPGHPSRPQLDPPYGCRGWHSPRHLGERGCIERRCVRGHRAGTDKPSSWVIAAARPDAQLRAWDCSVAFTERSQHLYGQRH